jgi:hypothetical protein
MAKLKQIFDRLALSVDLSQSEVAAYGLALHSAGLIPHGDSAEATPEATAWLILAVLCGSEPERAVERAREVANFRNFGPSAISFTDASNTGHQLPFITADPGLTFFEVVEMIFVAQAGKPEPVLPRVTIADMFNPTSPMLAQIMARPGSPAIPIAAPLAALLARVSSGASIPAGR